MAYESLAVIGYCKTFTTGRLNVPFAVLSVTAQTTVSGPR